MEVANFLTHGGFSFQGNNVDGSPTTLTQEIWNYSFDLGKWKNICVGDLPEDVFCRKIMISGSIIIIYGGLAFIFSGHSTGVNLTYLGNVANKYEERGMTLKMLEVSGDAPVSVHEQGVVLGGNTLYVVSVSSIDYTTNVHQLGLSTRKWELLYTSRGGSQEPEQIAQCQVVFSKGRLFMFDKRYVEDIRIYNIFSKIYMFDLTTKRWNFLQVKADCRVPEPGIPDIRIHYSYAQCPVNANFVYIFGGRTVRPEILFKDIWRLDLDSLHWMKLTMCVTTQPLYFHESAITPSGRLCCFGGITCNENSNVENSTVDKHISNDIMCAWITIPKLEVICWEAMLHYFKREMFASSEENLKKIGIPQKYVGRIIEARRTE